MRSSPFRCSPRAMALGVMATFAISTLGIASASGVMNHGAPSAVVADASTPAPVETPNAAGPDSSASLSSHPLRASRSKKVNYTPSVDIIVQSSFSTSTDAHEYGNGEFVNGTTRIGGKIDEKLLVKQLHFSYQHGYVDHNLGIAPTPKNIPIEDDFDDYRLNYDISKQANVALGYYYRHRVCCPGSAQFGNLAPDNEKQRYVEGNYSLPALKNLNNTVISFNAREMFPYHHAPASAAFFAAIHSSPIGAISH